jgi:O-antigen/teichoic acid export membrane protein
VGFVRNTLTVLLDSALGLPVALISSVILARYFSVPERGDYAVIIALAFAVATLSLLGWPTALVSRIRGARSDPARVVNVAFFGVLLFCLPVVALLIALAGLLSREFLDQPRPEIIYVGAGLALFQAVGLTFSSIAQALDRFDLSVWYHTTVRIGTAAALLLVLVVLGSGLTGALAATLIVRAVSTVGLCWVILSKTGLSWSVDLDEFRSCFSIGIRSYVQSTAGHLHERIDVFMLAYMAGGSDVAYYAVALSLIERLKTLPSAIGTALLPTVAGLGVSQAGQFTARVSRHSVLWMGAILLILLPATPALVPFVYGDRYEPSVTAALILLLAMGLLSVNRVLNPYFVSVHAQGISITVHVFSLLVNVLLNVLLIPMYGFVGAALASLASYGTAFLGSLATFRYRSGIPL